MGRRVILCLDMDAFFASVECALRPELQGKPVVVGGSPEGRGVVVSASYQARTYGVRSAMPAAQAIRLCPQAIFVSRNFKQYEQASRQVRAILKRFSPWVEMASIDEAFIDLSGSEQVLGPARQTARQIQEIIRQELSLPCSIAVASNKVVAKVACGRIKPNGLTEIAPGREARFLAPLPVTALPGIGPQTAARLRELRISTCGQLAAAPLLLLQRLLGRHAASVQRRAQGIDNAPVHSEARRAKSISRSTTFAEDSREMTFLRATLYRLTERVGHTLRRRGLNAASIAVQVRWANFSTQSHQCTLSPPAASDEVLYRRAGQLLNYLLSKDRQRVRLLCVRVSQLLPQGHQLSLFLPERTREQRALRLSTCLDDIRERHGFSVIQKGLVFLLRNRMKETIEDGERAFLTP